MSNPNDNTIPDGNTVGETNSPETEAVIKRLGPDYNTIHKDTHKERKRTLTQTSDHNIIHADEEKSARISCIKDVFTKENLYEKLPITQWLPKYDISCVVSDMIAGITVGLTVIPQGIAYAGVAGLPAQVGILKHIAKTYSFLIPPLILSSQNFFLFTAILVWTLLRIHGVLCVHDFR